MPTGRTSIREIGKGAHTIPPKFGVLSNRAKDRNGAPWHTYATHVCIVCTGESTQAVSCQGRWLIDKRQAYGASEGQENCNARE